MGPCIRGRVVRESWGRSGGAGSRGCVLESAVKSSELIHNAGAARRCLRGPLSLTKKSVFAILDYNTRTSAYVDDGVAAAAAAVRHGDTNESEYYNNIGVV